MTPEPPTNKITPDEAVALLNIRPGIVVAWVSKNGTKRDDDGNSIDNDTDQPWVMALGPFGSWPTTEEAAIGEIRQHEALYLHETIRLETCALWKIGWGFQVNKAKAAALIAERNAAYFAAGGVE